MGVGRRKRRIMGGREEERIIERIRRRKRREGRGRGRGKMHIK